MSAITAAVTDTSPRFGIILLFPPGSNICATMSASPLARRLRSRHLVEALERAGGQSRESSININRGLKLIDTPT